jgi:hypothetical protein
MKRINFVMVALIHRRRRKKRVGGFDLYPPVDVTEM